MAMMADPAGSQARRTTAPAGPLAGARILVVGAGEPLARARSGLAAEGAVLVDVVAEAQDAVPRVAATRPEAVLVPGPEADAVRALIDPVGLGLGPPVVAIGDGEGLERLGLEVGAARLRGRVHALESVVAGHAASAQQALEDSRLDALRRLAWAAEYRDDNTYEHTQRVGAMAALLARRLGLQDRTVELLRVAAPLHDIGKIAVPDAILLKPDRLTEEEFEVVKAHAPAGARILSGGADELLRTAEAIAASHHERWDGGGYPAGLAGADIPLPGRLVAVADVFDVLVHERPYKQEWTVHDAAEELRRNAGTQFDPDVVQAFDDLGAAVWQVLSSELDGL